MRKKTAYWRHNTKSSVRWSVLFLVLLLVLLLLFLFLLFSNKLRLAFFIGSLHVIIIWLWNSIFIWRCWILQVSLFALSFWSFHFASICAFGLLAYVGYIIYAFPSLFRLHRLNGLLLVFILLWAVSTYIFNVAFTFLNLKLGKVASFWIILYLLKVPKCSSFWTFCYSSYAGHGYMGNGWFVALSHTWILLACTVLSWNTGGPG